MTAHRPAIASHRGGAYLWPENSLTAFRASAALALEQMECDVHAAADGEAVIMHDATLDRMTDRAGPVAALDSAALRQVRVRGCAGEAVPMLDELLAVLAGSQVAPRIEVKNDAAGRPYPGLVPRVLGELDRHGMRGAAWLIGFDAPTMAAAMAAGGLAGAAWLLEAASWRALGVRGCIAVARSYGFPEIGVHEANLDGESVAAMRQAGLGISVWGANHAASIRRMLGLGVDVITTDDPVLAIALRG